MLKKIVSAVMLLSFIASILCSIDVVLASLQPTCIYEDPYSFSRVAEVSNQSLIAHLSLIVDNVDWGADSITVYFGNIFEEKNKTDLEEVITDYVSEGDWRNVLLWSARCGKLGLENETEIKWALDSSEMVNGFPKSGTDGEGDYFLIYDGELLCGFNWADKWSHDLAKWNLTLAYNNLHDCFESCGKGILWYYGPTSGLGFSNRFYDENAQTLRAFLLFHEFGCSNALNDARSIWSYINDNHWFNDAPQHYQYTPFSTGYECEAGFFYRIICMLKHYQPDMGNWSRILTDMDNRFLTDRWNSPQWKTGVGSTYVVVHHYPANSQRRLENTLGSWFPLLGFYDLLNATQRANMQDLLKGYDSYEPAWKLLLSSNANLYDANENKFKWHSDSSTSDKASSIGATLMFLMGITPETTTIAFPLEEYHYQYIYDIDPNLFRMNLTDSRIRLPILKQGKMNFTYNTVNVTCNFSSPGVYDINFADDWNSITNVTKLSELPSDRMYLAEYYARDYPVHNINTGLNYTTIQEAIDANETLDGDIIFVEAGTYYEHIVVNKTVSLTGENSSTTIIDGDNGGTIVEITVDNVTITGFTIQNSGWGWTRNGIYVHFADNCKIENNCLLHNCQNIRLNYSRGSYVINNTVNGDGYGIRLVNSLNCTATGNNVSNCIGGVHLQNATGCTVKRNRFTQNSQGIRLYSPCLHNKITENMVHSNTYDGMIEVMPENTTFLDNYIIHNNFINNTNPFICKVSDIIWDDGVEGNYWSSYNGDDLDHDGIGDTAHAINVDNTDNCPLMGIFQSFSTPSSYCVNIISNSTVEDFEYFTSDSKIMMHVSNMTENQTFGFCRTCIPHALMNPDEISIIIDGGLTPVLHVNLTVCDNGTHRWIYIAYEHSIREIAILSESSSHDIAITNITASKTVLFINGFAMPINIDLKNQGDFVETFNITLYADVNTTVIGDEITIGTQQTCLLNGATDTITFWFWSTDLIKDNYTISAYAYPVLGEVDTLNNNFTDGWITVTMVGDLTGSDGWPDGLCDIMDVSKVARLFGAIYPDPRYDANCDVVYDLKIDIKDVSTVARHFGEIDP